MLGVLTVYSIGHPLLISEQDVAQLITLSVVASHLLALALRVRAAEESAAGLRVALDGRAPVEQAKGIVAARLDLSPEEDAFVVISCLSQDRNAKVRDTAAALVRAPGDDGLDAALRATAIRRGLAVR